MTAQEKDRETLIRAVDFSLIVNGKHIGGLDGAALELTDPGLNVIETTVTLEPGYYRFTIRASSLTDQPGDLYVHWRDEKRAAFMNVYREWTNPNWHHEYDGDLLLFYVAAHEQTTSRLHIRGLTSNVAVEHVRIKPIENVPYKVLITPGHNAPNHSAYGGYAPYADVTRLADGSLYMVAQAAYLDGSPALPLEDNASHHNITKPGNGLGKIVRTVLGSLRPVSGGRQRVYRCLDNGRSWSADHELVELPYDQSHCALAQTPDGTLLAMGRATFFKGAGAPKPPIPGQPLGSGTYVTRSHDNGRNWQQQVQWLEPDSSATHGYCGGWQLHTLADGELFTLIEGRAESQQDWMLLATTSGDAGRNWTTRGELGSYENRSRNMGICEPGVAVLPGGRILVYPRPGWRTYYSDDKGASWQRGADIDSPYDVFTGTQIKNCKGECMADGTAFFSYSAMRDFVNDNDPGRNPPLPVSTGRFAFTSDGGKSYTFMTLPGEPVNGGIAAIETEPGVLLVIYGMRYNCYNGDLRAMLVRPNFETNELEPLPLDESPDPLSIRMTGPI